MPLFAAISLSLFLLGGCASAPAPAQYYPPPPDEVARPRTPATTPQPPTAQKADVERRLKVLNATVDETKRRLDKERAKGEAR